MLLRLLRRRPWIWAAVAVIACSTPGAVSRQPASSPSSAESSATPSPGGSTSSATLPLIAVVEARGPGTHYGLRAGLGDSYDTVAIAGFDGFARARQTFKPRAVPAIAGGTTVMPPPAVAVAGAVFYADGDGVIRRLKPGGVVDTVTSFSLTPQQELWFAVSPDGKQVTASVLTVPAPGTNWSVSLETATAGGQPKTITTTDLGAATPSPNLIAGWDAGGPLVSVNTQLVVPPTAAGGYQYHGTAVAHIDDGGQPTGTPLGGLDCKPWDSAPDGSVLCAGSPPTVRDPAGNVLWTLPAGSYNLQGRALSPDAGHVATDTVLIAADSWAEKIAFSLISQGWVDGTHLVGQIDDPAGKGHLDYVTAGDALRGHNLGFTAVLIGGVPTPPGMKNEIPQPSPKPAAPASPSPSPSP